MGAYVINIDEYKSIGNHWKALYVNGNNGSASYDAIYFDSFGVEHITKEIKKYIKNKKIKTKIRLYRIYWFYVKRQNFVRLYKFILF